jgi:large subunit ribosomal protein L1
MPKAKKDEVLDERQATSEEVVMSPTEEVKTAKAGKRSAKAIAEVEAKIEKEERKEKIALGELDPSTLGAVKQARPKTRTRLERRSKGFRKAAELVDAKKLYSLGEAIELATKTTAVKFDASIELHVNLGVDPRQADQNIRETIVMPEGTGKAVRVAVFAEADLVAEATKAGADVAGSDDFLQQLDKEIINFDVLIATPTLMGKLGKYARLLGPKGLMPNPKSGTVTKDITKAVKEAKAGKVEFRVDSTGIVHIAVGKASFGKDRLMTNTRAVLDSLKAAKPSSLKGNYVKKITVTSSMGPAIFVDLNEF